MKQTILIILLGIVLFPVFGGETVKLSYEECLETAYKSSLQAIYSSLEEKDLDLNLQSLWQQFLPELGYRVTFDKENHTYTYLGEGDAESTLPYYYHFDNNYIHVDDDSLIDRSKVKQELYFRLPIYSSHITELIREEKNMKLRKEIVKGRLKKLLTSEVNRNYSYILLYRDAITQLKELKSLYQQAPETAPEAKALSTAVTKRVLITLEERALYMERRVLELEQNLLSLLQLPLDTKLELTSPLRPIKLNREKDKETALENNIAMKYHMLNKRRFTGDLSALNLDYLPRLSVNLSSDITDNLNLGLTAYFYGSRNSGINLTSALLLSEDYLSYTTYGGDVEPTSPEWSSKEDLRLSITMSYSPDSIIMANRERKRLENNLLYLETRMKDEVRNIFNMLEYYGNHIREEEQLITLAESKFKATEEIKNELDNNFTITALNDITFYNTLLERLQSEMVSFINKQIDLYRWYLDYQNIIEG